MTSRFPQLATLPVGADRLESTADRIERIDHVARIPPINDVARTPPINDVARIAPIEPTWTERDLAAAGELQRRLLPPLEQHWRGVEIVAGYRPAHQVGGDFFDVVTRSSR